ncbi:MAG: hypothetical protein ACFFAY_10870 [Promethearchaeota archaeon]
MSKSTAATPDYPSPIGVALLAMLNIVIGLFAVFAGITIDFIMVGGDLTLVGSYQIGAIFVGVFAIVAGLGLWRLRSWAWWLAIIDGLLALFINLSIILIDNSQLRFYFLPILLRVVILVYLMQPSIKSRFR